MMQSKARVVLALMAALGMSGAADAQSTAAGTLKSGQTVTADQIRDHMEVKGSDRAHVGIVDKVQGQSITLTRDDPGAGDVHHVILLASAASIENGAVILRVTAAEAKRTWQEAAPPAGDKRP